jgi:hypothetical protein
MSWGLYNLALSLTEVVKTGWSEPLGAESGAARSYHTHH